MQNNVVLDEGRQYRFFLIEYVQNFISKSFLIALFDIIHIK